MGKHEITPDGIDKITEAINEASENEKVDAIADAVESKLSPRARAAIYDTGKWAGAIGTVGLSAAAFIDGKPGLLLGAAAALLLAVSNFIAKRHVA